MADCSGIVPVIVVLDGPAVSGPALLIGLADFVIMTEEAYAFVSGPSMVAEFTGSRSTTASSACHHPRPPQRRRHPGGQGPPRPTRRRRSALVPAVAHGRGATSHGDDRPAGRLTPEVAGILPTTAAGSYDVRDVIGVLVDDGHFVELRSRWAPNLVTALATVDGRPVGVLANQPLAIAGTLDIPASQKGARFVAFCDAFNLPILTLVDTPGFYPGKDLEWRGMIRHGAQLVFAYGRATVPGLCDPAQELRRCVHRHGLQAHGQRRLPGVARRRAGRDGRGSGVGHPPAERHGGAPGAFEEDYAERLLNPYIAAERGIRRCGHRAGRDPAGDHPRPTTPGLQAGATAPAQARQLAALDP